MFGLCVPFNVKMAIFLFWLIKRAFAKGGGLNICAEGFKARLVATKDMICSAVMGGTELHKEPVYSMG